LRIESKKRTVPPKSTDVFQNPFLARVSGGTVLEYQKGKLTFERPSTENKKWRIVIIKNKYPAVSEHAALLSGKKSFFPVLRGLGEHDILITKEYKDNFPRLSSDEAFHVFEAFRERYLMFLSDPKIKYVSVFHNWGKMAGASVFHPHYQILAIPVVPPDVEHSIEVARKYSQKNKKCVYCAMIDWEKKEGKRIIMESKYSIAFAPFVSRNSFEIKIFPKNHRPFFENTQDVELQDMALLLQRVLRKVEKNLYDTDYNFYIHTSPVDKKQKNKFYHWYIEVVPRWNIPAGFEYATGIFINVVDPDVAAKILKK
jgi:UDPglucose--hexose-1-phosphate uridylyltransferase